MHQNIKFCAIFILFIGVLGGLFILSQTITKLAASLGGGGETITMLAMMFVGLGAGATIAVIIISALVRSFLKNK